MSFQGGSQLDTSQVSVRRGGSGMKIGGGIGGILVVVVMSFLFGPEVVGGMLGSGQSYSSAEQQALDPAADENLESTCQTGEDANRSVDCRVVGTVNSLNAYWNSGVLLAEGVNYRAPGAVLAQGSWDTGCGTGSSAMGPFYCPADETAYFDVSFFDQLSGRFGASTGPLAQEYVVAHEFGHHIQTLTGQTAGSGYQDTGPQGDAARQELQADCYAGLWAANAATTPDPETGQPFLEPLTRQDVADALSAAAAVGDDTIQRSSGAEVSPETWTHGSSEQRQEWFTTGYEEATYSACDTWSAETV